MFRRFRRPAASSVSRGKLEAIRGFSSTARTHEGAFRDLNEDRYIDMPTIGMWAVADGMGGHRAGDLAAQMTVDALTAIIKDDFAPTPPEIHEAVGRVNTHLLGKAGSANPGATSGSTLVALVAAKGRYTCLWAGDSRAYVLRDKQLISISHDHSLVQELVDAGVLSSSEARIHPRSNVITRAIGVAEALTLEAATGFVCAGDRFLLCSDGLIGTLEEDEILAIVAESRLEASADSLLQIALAKEPRDNVTFILIDPLHEL